MEPPEWSAPAFEPLVPGDPPVLGGYRVLARLGAGGMGRVYLATTQSGRRLAVKVVRPEFADDPEFRRRFAQEITAAQRVQSLYTAPVIDADPDGPRPWMATAHVPGPSLAQAVAHLGPLPEPTVRTLFAGIAEALQAVHAANVVHRDLKPSNVLLAADGPRVIDFGIARAADTTPLTRTGMRIGSPQFMAPEQALGHASTPAIDVFALGSVAYYAATGRTPFGDGPDTAVLFRIAHEEPDLDGCPGALRDLIGRCLAKDPAGRPLPRTVLTELETATGVPSPDWLPDDVTRRLPAYAAAPPQPPVRQPGPPPQPQHPTTPYPPTAQHPAPPGTVPGTGPQRGPVPPAGPPRDGLCPTAVKALAAAGGAVVVLVLLAVMAVALTGGDGDDPAAAGASGAPTGAAAPVESPSGPVPSPGGTAGVPAPSGPGSIGTQLGHYTKINLTDGYDLSFTDDPMHPKEREGDVHFGGNYFDGSRFSVLEPGQKGTYEECRDNTRYASELGEEYIIKGKKICANTESGLVGLLEITGTGTEPDEYVVLDLTVWQGVPPTPEGE